MSAAVALPRRTSSLCARCKRSVEAELRRVDGRVILWKECPDHGLQEALVSSNADWYEGIMAQPPLLEPVAVAGKKVAQGCPFDCGACTAHEQRVRLPIIPITSDCDRSCPICYTVNRSESAYHMSVAELRAILNHLATVAPGKQIVNITGGEPTLHPELGRFIDICREEGMHRTTLSTHGLGLATERVLLEKLAQADARVILSFDSFEESVNEAMLGGNVAAAKLQALELLERHDIATTLLPAVARGYNAEEVGKLVELACAKDFIRSVELHTMTFTGQRGLDFDRGARITTYEVLADLERTTKGMLRIRDFVSYPSAHPLCYLICYLLRLEDGRWLPFTRFMTRDDIRELLRGALYLEPGPRMERIIQDVINRLWAGELSCDDTDLVLATLKRQIGDIFAPDLSHLERMRRAERSTMAVYVHAHMDEETFDTDRIRQCCVSICEPDGTTVPSCAYNVLYRQRDARFAARPRPAVSELGPGRKWD